MDRAEQTIRDAIMKNLDDHPETGQHGLVKGDGRGHNFDEDSVCIDCGFDGAEWSHWKHHTYEGKASPATKRPRCTHVGRPVDVHPPRDDQDDWGEEE